jgi:hypothetical protein
MGKHAGELGKGFMRLAASAANGLGWVVDFARRDLEQLSAGDALNLEYEFRALSMFGSPSRKRGKQHVHSETFESRPMKEGELQKAQAIAQEILQDAVQGKIISRSLPPMTRYVFVSGDEPFDFVTTDERLGQFTNAVLDLIVHRGAMLRHCAAPDCKTGMFIADRKTARFCSNVCKAREGMRKIRKGGRRHGK